MPHKKFLGSKLTNWSTTNMRLHKFKHLRMEQNMGKLYRLLKEEFVVVKRQLSHLNTYLVGIKYMTVLPIIIIDHHKEYTTMRECTTLEIPIIW